MADADVHLLLAFLEQSSQLRPVVDGLLKSACSSLSRAQSCAGADGASSYLQHLLVGSQAVNVGAWQDREGFDATPKKSAGNVALLGCNEVQLPWAPPDAAVQRELEIVDIEVAHDVDAPLLLNYDPRLGHFCVQVSRPWQLLR